MLFISGTSSKQKAQIETPSTRHNSS